MSSINVVQSVWSRGITETIMQARSDTDILAKGASVLENVIMLEQGGLKKRPALSFIADLGTDSDGGTLDNAFACQLPWGETVIIYSILMSGLTPGKVMAYFINANTTITVDSIPGNVPMTGFVQDNNELLVAVADNWRKYIINQDNTATALSFTVNAPYIIKEPYPTTPHDCVVLKLPESSGSGDYFAPNEKVYFAIVDTYSDGTAKAANTFIAPSMIFSAANPLIWIAIGGLLLKLDAPITIDSNAGGTLHMYPATVLIDSSIDVKAITNITFYSLSTHSFYGIKASSKEVGFGWDAWYGHYPKYITKFQNRIWAAVNDYDNKTVWVSEVGDGSNFFVSGVEATDPLAIEPAGNLSPIITNLVSGITINIFTTQGIYSFINQTNTAITPDNFFLQKQNSRIITSVATTEYDQQLFYVDNYNVRSLQYSDVTLQEDNNATLFCPSIMVNPHNMVAVSSLDGDDNGYLFVLNTGENQNISCYQSVHNQEIFGWTKWLFNITDFAIQKLITANNRLFLIAFTDNKRILCEFKYNIYEDKIDDSDTSYSINCKIITNPYSRRDQITGNDLLFNRLQIGEIKIMYYNTDSIIVNGIRYDLQRFDQSVESLHTGIFEGIGLDGTDYLQQLTIEHNDNNPFVMLGLSVKITYGS